jgi:succinate-semialdehyde dehydrogenase/glutarate-semialdehyde dehydrogenase
MSLVTINPATGRRLAVYRENSRADIERKLARGAAAQARWRKLSHAARGKFFRALARELRADPDGLAALAAAEMGKPVAQGRAEVEKCAMLCEYYAAQGARLLADEHPAGAPANARVVHEPLGIVLAIMPWNFPFWQVIRAAIPVLTGGNAFLLKHAPNVAGCALAVEKLFARARFPAGVFQVLLTGTGVVPALLADSRVRAVTLTGSTAAGKAVAALAGAAMKPGVFELGGSDPAIVLEDADLALAAETCALSRLINAGQSCVCAKRFIVVRSVLREFEERFVARVGARRVGDPLDAATDIGPLARADLRANLHAQVQQSVRRGARVLLGGKPLPGPGFFYAPTVLTNVRPGMAVHDQEVFGPVAAIIAVRDEAAAIRVANDSPFGLAASVFTRSRARATRVATQLDAGAVFVNDFVRSMAELPFGGVKESGFGRELGAWGARAFVNVKTLVGA